MVELQFLLLSHNLFTPTAPGIFSETRCTEEVLYTVGSTTDSVGCLSTISSKLRQVVNTIIPLCTETQTKDRLY